jgi:predicted nucleic acid-binding protein
MAADPAFVDTNVLVYANQETAEFHERASARMLDLEQGGTPLWISRQILREYLAVVTRQHGRGAALPAPLAVGRVRQFEALFGVAEDGPAVTKALLDLLTRFPTAGRQVHDANIVSTMLAHGIDRLLTFNTADFERFSGVIRLEPV